MNAVTKSVHLPMKKIDLERQADLTSSLAVSGLKAFKKLYNIIYFLLVFRISLKRRLILFFSLQSIR